MYFIHNLLKVMPHRVIMFLSGAPDYLTKIAVIDRETFYQIVCQDNKVNFQCAKGYCYCPCLSPRS